MQNYNKFESIRIVMQIGTFSMSWSLFCQTTLLLLAVVFHVEVYGTDTHSDLLLELALLLVSTG